eukprot:4617929-Pyramimonas_sp.AAC.1
MRGLWANLHARNQEQLIAQGRFKHSRYQRRFQTTMSSILSELKALHDREGPVPTGHEEDQQAKWRALRDEDK